MESAIKPKPSFHGKRKQHPPISNPLAGILTRNKSRRYVQHCTRSGKIRSDPVCRTHPSGGGSGLGGFDNGVVIKDLRSHRVFSPPLVVVKDENPSFDCELGEGKNPNLSVLVNCYLDVDNEGLIEQKPKFDFPKGEIENPSLVDCKLGEMGNPNLSVLVKSDLDADFDDNVGLIKRNPNLSNVNTNCDLGVGCNEQNCKLLEKCDPVVDSKDEESNGQNPNLLNNYDKGVDSEIQGSNGQNPNLLGQCDSVKGGKEERSDVGLTCNGSIPNNMSPNSSVKNLNGRKSESSEGLVEVNVQTTPPDVVVSLSPSDDCNVVAKGDVALRLPQNQVGLVKDGSAEDKKTDSILKQTSVLKPCSRPRVFKVTNSFSYRRLLPYLMDLAKDTSGPLKLDDCPKSENNDIIKPVVSGSRDPPSVNHESDEKKVSVEPVEVLEVNTGTNSKEEKELSVDPQLNASTQHVSTQIPMDQSHDDHQKHSVPNENQSITHSEQISSENDEKVEDSSPVNESQALASSEISKESPKACQENAIVEHPVLLALQVECKTKEDSVSVFDETSNVNSGTIASLPKGILKKNPRGCRGICDCLNCALFRVNAEKAFDFSRNQLLDTEELVHDMVKEMANLRSLLEKTDSMTGSPDGVSVNQVQEACNRASNIETLATNRLTQMKEDLYIHSRTKPLHRPRVNFPTEEPNKQMQGTPMP